MNRPPPKSSRLQVVAGSTTGADKASASLDVREEIAPSEPQAPSAGDASVRAVSRALQLLLLLNLRQSWSLHDLHLQTGLAKSTIFRLLHTLQAEGFVKEDVAASVYGLTQKVRELSSGYQERSTFIDVGAPIALALTKKIKWPVAIGVLEGGHMVVRSSGMPYSAIAPRSNTLGLRLGIANTAMGRAYLAHCSAIERESLLDMLRSSGSVVPKNSVLDVDLEIVRREGYAVRMPSSERRTASLAVPILLEAEVLGVLCVSTFGDSMTKELITRTVPLLMQAAREIAITILSSAAHQ